MTRSSRMTQTRILSIHPRKRRINRMKRRIPNLTKQTRPITPPSPIRKIIRRISSTGPNHALDSFTSLSETSEDVEA